MSLLTQKEVARYALAHGYIYEHVCDEQGCGKLIRPGELCVVLKWKKKEKGSPYFEARLAERVRCMTCERERHPQSEAVKVKAAGRGAKKVSVEVAATIQIDAVVRKAVISLLKRNEGSIEKSLLIPKLLRKKAIREIPKKVLAATIRGMRKLKLIRGKANTFVLSQPKKGRKKNS